MDDLRGHIIIAGFGRVGQMVSQLLSERLIQFVALDVRTERVQVRRLVTPCVTRHTIRKCSSHDV